MIFSQTIEINAAIPEVWDALINPAIIKEYLYGTQAVSDWKVGSKLTFSGEWEGKSYEDLATITAMEPEKRFAYRYWSSFSGKENLPENYANVCFTLLAQGNKTVMTIEQDGIADKDAMEHSEIAWRQVLDKFKEVVEN